MLVSLARNRISVTRQKTTGKQRNVDGGVVQNLPTPFQPCSILVELRDNDTGTALIEGTDSNDVSQNETVSFTSSKLGQGIKLFKTISRVTLTDIDSGNHVYVRYRGLDGSSVKVQEDIYTCINAQISASRQNWNNDRSGTVENGNIKIMIPLYCSNEDNKIQAGDLITDLDSNQVYLATGMILEEGVGINRFQIVYAQRRERT